MNIIDNKNLGDFSYVVLPDDFEISDEPKIIFAPNGTGKTTLFNILIKQNKNNCEIYTYDEASEVTYKAIEGKKKKFEINLLSKNYSKELENMEKEKANLLLKDEIKVVYPSKTKTQLKKEIKNKELNEEINKGVCTLCAPLDDNDRANLKYILPYFQDIKKIIFNRDKLKDLTEKQKKSDIEALELNDRKFFYTYYNVENHKKDIKRSGCPFCGNMNKNVYEEILRIREEVISKKIEFFKDYEFLRHLEKGVNPLEAINMIIGSIKNLSDEKILFLLKTKGEKNIEEHFKISVDKYKDALTKMNNYKEEQENAFNNMKASKEIIEKNFPKLYPNSSIKFDDKKKSITINTPRNFCTYSEGEKHEMYSTIREPAIIGREKEIVIADDPLTDFDIPNEYKNVFRFVRLITEKRKKVIIFTCNPNFINIANEYCSTSFDKYYLLSHTMDNENLKLRLLKMNFNIDKKNPNPYISLSHTVEEDLSKVNNQVVHMINERADLFIAKSDDKRKNEISEILHYDCSKEIIVKDEITFCNDKFVSSIENFNELPSYSSFIELVRDRVYYLAALRVYLEEKLFKYQQKRISKNLSDPFPIRENKPYLTKNKIIKVDEIDDDFKIVDMYPKWNRSILMCLKTMLNDNDHPYSQILPVSYAISLGNDTLSNEILLLKDMFS